MLQPFFVEMVGQGSTFVVMQNFVKKAARSSSPLLLHGEVGSGKETTSRSIHLSSNRRNHPFLVVDCSLYYERELERELFGVVEHGDQAPPRKGILEFSSRGTCYLANVEELSPSIQERLLNYLETGYLERIGSKRPVPSKVRLIFSSTKDLAAFSEGGLFSNQLYARISKSTLHLLPLREHPEDIRPFVRQLVHLASVEHYDFATAVEFSTDTWEALESYPWPGNYDELKAELLRVFRTGVYRITPQALSPEISHYWAGRQNEPRIRQVIDEIEEYIQEFKIMVRLDAEYGEILLDSDDWDLDIKLFDRT